VNDRLIIGMVSLSTPDYTVAHSLPVWALHEGTNHFYATALRMSGAPADIRIPVAFTVTLSP
jgi:hypothetical protein